MQSKLLSSKDFHKRQVIVLLSDRTNLLKKLEKSHVFMLNMLHQIEEIKQTSQMMMLFLQDLLNLAHIENNKFTLNQNIFNFFDAIEEAFFQVSHLAQKKSITLQLPDVPHQLEDYFATLYGDKNRYIQILVNFLSNAIKFSEPGSKVSVLLETQDLQFASETSSSS